MRAYLAEDLPPELCRRLADFARERGYASSLEGLFWLPVPESLWSPLQREHAARCGPYAVSLEIGEDFLRLELLVRACNRLHCDCVAPADSATRQALIDRLEELISECDLPH
ncbi:hypothetical protein [uncultured Desulfovibrio sp.]|uniref:hypothetical protein n=1 Tax=uncultured Desulfovibrio sp. TaxID=167968 RepID=UPI0025DD39E1|nr:hypothetical protein [uncultured Desulfovibrio sp.]